MAAATERGPRCAAAWLLRGVGMLVARLPQPLLLALGRALAWSTAALQRRRRRIAAANLALCFPQLSMPSRQALLRDTLRQTVIGLLECLRAWYAPSALLQRLLVVEGREHLQAARAGGGGVLLLSAHFTMVELALRLSREGAGEPVTAMKRPHNNACLEAEVDRCRRHRCGPTIDKNDARGLLAALGQGALVFYAADQDFNFRHAFVPFFGVPAATTTATATLLRRSRATVLPCWFHRREDGRYVMRIGAPWAALAQLPPEQSAAAYMHAVEEQVRLRPAQYLWVHRRFKTRPPGAAPVY